MKKALPLAGVALASGVLAAGCVPAADDPDPRGGVGVFTEPSPASKGESFVTADGWTVRVEELVLQTYVLVWPRNGAEGGYGGRYLFRAADPQQFIVPAIPVGPTKGLLTPMTRVVGEDFFESPDTNRGVSLEIEARFNRISDDIPPSLALSSGSTAFEVEETGPALLLVCEGRRGGLVVRLDLAIGDTGSSSSDLMFDVTKDALAQKQVLISAETFFSEQGKLVFDDIANADADHDGVISPSELRRYKIPECDGCTAEERQLNESDASAKALSSIFGRRMSGLLVAR